MTITEANEIWNACYGDPMADGAIDAWQRYTSHQRLQAIEIRNAQEGGVLWGVFNISDRD